MKKLFKQYQILILSLFLIPIFYIFGSHNIFSGVDELRVTLVPSEISRNGTVFFKDLNNARYNTKIFVKTGFLINNDKQLYPNGFILNSLILVPYFSIAKDVNLALNIFAYIVLLTTFLYLYLIFKQLKMPQTISIMGAFLFVLSNFYLSLYVSYFPDNVLLLFVAAFIYYAIKNGLKLNLNYCILIFIISSFLFAFKITMYPILFTFYFLVYIYLFLHRSKIKVLKYILLFIPIFFIFNFPLIYSNKIGPSYAELAGNKNDNQATHAKQYSNSVNKESKSKFERIATIFWEDFILPKDSGKYLIGHLEKDAQFFAANNFIVLFGFISILYLYKKNRYLSLLIFSIFTTSFLLWGNMNVYGGSIDFHLRNSHIRYLLPIFLLFFVIGYWTMYKTIKNRLLISLLLTFILYNSYVSLTHDYPFTTYSLMNKDDYLNSFVKENSEIEKLNLPTDGIYLSAVFDDYDLSYRYKNYGDLKLLSKDKVVLGKTINNIITKNDKTYFIIPKKDSIYNPFTSKDLNDLLSNLYAEYAIKLIYENENKKIYNVALKK
jgi:hypothetical protein